MRQARLPIRYVLLPAALLLATALLAPAAAADTLITLDSRQVVTLDGEAQPEREYKAQIWIGDGVIARDDAETRTVLAGDELLLISHRNRNYNRLTLPIDPLDLAPPAMREEVGQRLAEAKLSGGIEPSDETQEVGEWTAKRYDLSLSSEQGMSVDMTIWASPEVEADAASYHALTRALASMQVGGSGWVDLLAEVDGFPVRRETTMTSDVIEVVSTETVLSVEENEPPAGIYGPPAGYAEVELPAGNEAPAEEGEMDDGGEMEEEEEMEDEGEG